MTRVPRPPRARARRAGRALPCAALVALALLLPVPAAHLPVAAPAVTSAAERAPSSVSDYIDRVGRARSEARRADPDTISPPQAAALAQSVTELLPDGERVAAPGGEIEVDASVLGGLTTRLAAAKTAHQRADALERLQGHLDSLQLAVGGEAGAEASRVRSDPEALAALLDRGRSDAGPTLSERLGELVQDALRWLRETFGRLLTPEQSQTAESVFWVVLIVVLALLLVYVLFRFLVSMRLGVARRDAEMASAAEAGRPVVAAAEGLPSDALAYAEELADRGEYRAAVRALFGGAARTLVEEGVLAQTRTRTDAELLADVAPAAPRAHPPLSLLTADFERAWYGHADPGADGYSRARGLYAQVLKAVAA